MLKDLPKQKRQRLWLRPWLLGAGTPTCAQAKAPPGKTHEGSGDQDKRSFDLSEQWLRAYHVLALARASSGT
jgi:hypothetical protein